MKFIKKSLSLFGVVASCFLMGEATAMPRTLADAQQIAQNFWSGTRSASTRSGAARSEAPLVPVATSSDFIATTRAVAAGEAYYVFAPQANDATGFVIVSGDDRLATILAYSDNSSFNKHNLPSGLIDILNMYQQEFAISQTAAYNSQGRIFSGKQIPQTQTIQSGDVGPLIRTRWNQGSPYNNLCPVVRGQHSATGCAATASAQLLYYYQSPSHGIGNISYTTSQGMAVNFDFANTTFKWSDMLLEYRSGYSYEQGNAVAELMAACGAASRMDYDAKESGATVMNHMDSFLDFFGYDADLAFADRDRMSITQWHELLLSQLSQSHPVIIASTPDGDGHTFIIDGYQNDDAADPSYHINWGWGGQSDGYFKISALKPGSVGIGGNALDYSYNQQIFLNCFPENGKTDMDSFWQGESMEVSPQVVTKGASSILTIQVDKIYNQSKKAFRGDFEYYLSGNGKEIFLASQTINADIEFFYGFSSRTYNAILPDDLPEGTYEVIVKTRSAGGSAGEVIRIAKGNAKVVVSDAGGDIDAPEFFANIQTTGFNIQECSGRTVKAEVLQICNFGDLDFSGRISLALADESGKVVSHFGDTKEVYGLVQFSYFVDPVILSGTIPDNVADGYYRLCVAANQTGYSGWSPLKGYSLSNNYIVTSDEDIFRDVMLSNGQLSTDFYSVKTSVLGKGGSVEASLSKVAAHGEVSFTFTCEEGYTIGSAKLNNVDVTADIMNNVYVAKDVTENLDLQVSFNPISYKIKYMVDGEEYMVVECQYGSYIVPLSYPEKEGYTFSGWDKIPSSMPANDIEVKGSFTVNQYTISWIIDNVVYKSESIVFGSPIIAPSVDLIPGYDFAWDLTNVPSSMPAYDLTVNGYYTVGIAEMSADDNSRISVYTLDGRAAKANNQRGIYIINGKKVIEKK